MYRINFNQYYPIITYVPQWIFNARYNLIIQTKLFEDKTFNSVQIYNRNMYTTRQS